MPDLCNCQPSAGRASVPLLSIKGVGWGCKPASPCSKEGRNGLHCAREFYTHPQANGTFTPGSPLKMDSIARASFAHTHRLQSANRLIFGLESRFGRPLGVSTKGPYAQGQLATLVR